MRFLSVVRGAGSVAGGAAGVGHRLRAARHDADSGFGDEVEPIRRDACGHVTDVTNVLTCGDVPGFVVTGLVTSVVNVSAHVRPALATHRRYGNKPGGMAD